MRVPLCMQLFLVSPKEISSEQENRFTVSACIVTDLLKAMLGNTLVNTFQHATTGELCFLLHVTARC
jgi:hypothetical protein